MVDILEHLGIEPGYRKPYRPKSFMEEIEDNPILKEESEDIKMEIVNIGENISGDELTKKEHGCVDILHEIAVREMNIKEKVDWKYIERAMNDICMAESQGNEPTLKQKNLKFALKAGRSYGSRTNPQYDNTTLIKGRSLVLANQVGAKDKKAFTKQFSKGRDLGAKEKWGTSKVRDPGTREGKITVMPMDEFHKKYRR